MAKIAASPALQQIHPAAIDDNLFKVDRVLLERAAIAAITAPLNFVALAYREIFSRLQISFIPRRAQAAMSRPWPTKNIG